MPPAVFAAAQCAIRDGDIPANLALHLAFMRQAHEQGVDLLLFPELSLTGYAPPCPVAWRRTWIRRCWRPCASSPRQRA